MLKNFAAFLIFLLGALPSTAATRNTFLKRGITLHYAYTDRNGYDLFMIEVAPKDCGF